MGLDVSFDLWKWLCPVLRGRGGRLSIQKVSDIHKAVVSVEKIVFLRQDLLCFFQRCWRLRKSISFLKPSLEHQLPGEERMGSHIPVATSYLH
jgi:hypothetical protein